MHTRMHTYPHYAHAHTQCTQTRTLTHTHTYTHMRAHAHTHTASPLCIELHACTRAHVLYIQVIIPCNQPARVACNSMTTINSPSMLLYIAIYSHNNTCVCVLHLVTTTVDHCESIIIGSACVTAGLQHKQTVASCIPMNLCTTNK